jgi:hypothetical protein
MWVFKVYIMHRILMNRTTILFTVQRILSSRAGCLLLEGSVANAAARMLLEKGISVVTNVKLDVLERSVIFSFYFRRLIT